eukprot:4609626-Ditylum_brightwellii.AAC.1
MLDESGSQDKQNSVTMSITLDIGGSQPSNDFFATCFSATSDMAQQVFLFPHTGKGVKRILHKGQPESVHDDTW